MNEKIEVPTMKVPPLKKICMTIGQLPASYVETMSYYEMLVWFVHYLRDDIIPVVNANGEATRELQELYGELQEYVNNYFDNLDVQEEINNKLDEMADSGELTDIIAQYLGLAGMITFNSVAEMKLAENLVNGSKCATLGYHTANDNGKAFYKVRTITNEDVVDESIIIALHDNTLVAELIKDYQVNIKQLGFDTANMTAAEQTTALNYYFTKFKNLLIKDENITINNSLYLDDNQKLEIINSNIHNTATANQTFILTISGKSNIEIKGLNSELYFDKPEQTQQACVKIVNGTNINVYGLRLKKAGGDGITISGSNNETISSNVIIDNCIIDNNRRNGISAIGGIKGCTIKNCTITNTSGTNPQYAIDLESWQDGVYNEDIFIDKCTFTGNRGAIDIMPFNKNIRITNCYFANNQANINSVITVAAGENAYPKNVVIDSNTFEDKSIYLKGTQYAHYVISNNYFYNGNITLEAESDFVSYYTSYPKNGSIDIINNVIKNAPENSLSISGASNVLIQGNYMEKPTTRCIYTSLSNNLIISKNTFKDHAQTEENTSTTRTIHLATTHNVTIEGNSFIDTNDQITFASLISCDANVQKLITINNNALNSTYTNFLSKWGTITKEVYDNNLTN